MAGYDEQLLVQSEAKCLQASSRRNRIDIRAPNPSGKPVRRLDGPRQAKRKHRTASHAEEKLLHACNEHRLKAHHSGRGPEAQQGWFLLDYRAPSCLRLHKFSQGSSGGLDSILINAGSDCTEEFDAIHSSKAKAMLEDYRIGELMTTTSGFSYFCQVTVNFGWDLWEHCDGF